MIALTLITVGSLKESYWRAAEEEYRKRLSPYARIVVHEVDHAAFKKPTESDRVLKEEGDRILKLIPKDACVMLCDREGKAYASEQFSHLLMEATQGGNPLCVIIGGPLGVSGAVKQKANLRVSWGLLTLPHQLARIVLHEQLYRAMTIASGKAYHY